MHLDGCHDGCHDGCGMFVMTMNDAFARLIRARPSAGKSRMLKIDTHDASSLFPLIRHLVTSQRKVDLFSDRSRI
jgi:hypothetical protein